MFYHEDRGPICIYRPASRSIWYQERRCTYAEIYATNEQPSLGGTVNRKTWIYTLCFRIVRFILIREQVKQPLEPVEAADSLVSLGQKESKRKHCTETDQATHPIEGMVKTTQGERHETFDDKT
jgi:hypothetical protein